MSEPDEVVMTLPRESPAPQRVEATELIVAAEYPTRAHADQAAARLIGEGIWATVFEPTDSMDHGGEAWTQVLVQQGEIYTARIMLDLMHDVDLGRSGVVRRMPRSWWSSYWYLRIAALVVLVALVTPAVLLVLVALEVIEPLF